MGDKIKVLLIGESWMIHTMEAKGFDVFYADSYGEGKEFIQEALTTDGIEFEHMPCHKVSVDFPTTVEDLNAYDVILVSDIGANTFLLPVETFLHSKTSANKLQLLHDWIQQGGGFCMIGGYLSFMGIEGKGRYYDTILEKALPINFLSHDDRKEHPEGISVNIDPQSHPILKGLPSQIDGILGYNKALPKDEANVIASIENDPFIALWSYGEGRSLIYSTDCAPHWSSPEFSSSETYKKLWQQIVKWLAKRL
jgi:uncharacterized membrane protein